MTGLALDGGGWQVRACLGDEWRWHAGPDKPWDAPGWLPARVPGSVVEDLWRAGEVPDPYHARNSLLIEWVAERAWLYRTRLSVAGERGVLRFGGVDHAATVLLGGEEVARHEGAFTPFEVEVPGGEHLLAVVVHPAPESEPQVGETSRVRVHKSRMGYGWDFCPRLVHQGIWRPVTLDPEPESFPVVRLEDGVGTVEVDGEVLLRVESPELWWPNGSGPQRLYRAGAFDVGFRTVELDAEYRLRVNGEPVPVRGWNWVPLDVLYGVPRPEKLAHLLELAARAGANLLRVWGGGLIETREFYEHCDRLGLMVWQEFAQSSSGVASAPSDDRDFVELMADEARAIVPRLRRHASLVVWCGGNELDGDDSTPVLAALREVVEELDPDRPWLPTSPLGDADAHGPWEHQGLAAHNGHYDSRTSRLHSEFGVEGMTNRRALEAAVPPEQRWPADRSNPVYRHLGDWWINAPLVQASFGGRIADVATMRRASQHLQHDGLRYAVEACRRRGAGSIPWQLNEPYPNAWCTSAVDHRGDPKPAFYGVARAYAGHPAASFATFAWGGRGSARATVEGPARFVDLDGTVVAERPDAGDLEADLDAFGGDVFLLDLGPIRYVMTRAADLAPLLDLPRTLVEARWARDDLSLANVGPVAALGLLLEDARPYDAPGWAVFEDNYVDLLPGEERTIGVEWRDAPGDGRTLVLSGWNVEERRVA